MGWGKYLAALAIVVAGLAIVDAFAPRATVPLIGLILLSVAVTRPGFVSELQKLTGG